METEGTVEVQPADDSISADLAASFNNYEEVDEQNETEQIDQESEQIESEAETGDTEEGVDSEAEQDNTSDQILAPEHWPQEDKDRFNALNELGEQGKEAQQWMLDRHKAMEADYTRKTQEIADFKRNWSDLDQAIQPYVEGLKQAGVTPAQYFMNLGKADQFLQQDPEAAIQWLADKYGVNLGNYGGEKTPESQEISSLKKQINELRQGIDQDKQSQYQTEVNTQIEKIQSFMDAKDESGALMHPFAEDVINDMIILANAQRSQGKNPDLNDLYEQAVWANPVTRDKKLTADKQAEEKKRSAEARAKAAKSKKAQKIVASSGASSPDSDLSLRDEIASQF
jgi:hypothetical protein